MTYGLISWNGPNTDEIIQIEWFEVVQFGLEHINFDLVDRHVRASYLVQIHADPIKSFCINTNKWQIPT